MDFNNKVVLVLGGSGGIGSKTALQFAKEGATVAIVGRNENKLAQVEEEISKIGKNPLVIKADISKYDEAMTVVARTVAAFGKLDVLVNCAGILRPTMISDANFLEVYDEIMNINLRALLIITTQAVPYIKETKGNIINLTSYGGITVHPPGFLAYKISKVALIHFTRGLALELGEYGVRANIVCLGPVRTNIFETSGLKIDCSYFKNYTVLDKISEPEEVADLIVYLASDKARSVTGSNYVMDNGVLLK